MPKTRGSGRLPENHDGKEGDTAAPRKSPIQAFRKRLLRRGPARVEVHLQKADADPARGVARALGDPQTAAETRGVLSARFAKPATTGLKALPAAAPLEGVDLDLPRDLGREVDPLNSSPTRGDPR